MARVVLLTAVPHLDRPFDYEVPQSLSDAAQPGVRVRVRLAGRLVDGFVLERVASSQHALQPLRSVHGPPVLTAPVADLCRAVADRYAGTMADVLRSAVPPRHARAERGFARSESAGPGPATAPGATGPDAPGANVGAWSPYAGGCDLVATLGGERPVRALWVSGPGEAVPERVADMVAAVASHGRGVLVVAPDAADVARLSSALSRHPTGPVGHVTLTAIAGPESRYRTFLEILSGRATVVLGTRGAVFAPVADLGAIIVWDDADDSLAEPHAPGWHAREVAVLRSARQRASLVLAGPSVSLEAARLVESGWMARVALPREALRAAMPRVQAAADLSQDPHQAGGRIPAVALDVLREGVGRGPVLVSVPRAGYLPMLACQTCREPVRCPACTEPMRAEGAQRVPACPTHGPVGDWRCPLCGGQRLRAAVVGVRRTAEEVGRALPGVPVASSSGEQALRELPRRGGIVVATPGAEPDPGRAGYAALVVLDVGGALSRPGLRVPEEVLRRWLLCASLVRPASEGGRVLVVGVPGAREVQALVRWDPYGYAVRELEERRALHLAPAVRTALLVGPAPAAADLAAAVCDELADRVLRRAGPLPGLDQQASGVADRGPGPTAGTAGTAPVAYLLAVAVADGEALARALQRQQAVRSARRSSPVSVRIDPVRLP